MKICFLYNNRSGERFWGAEKSVFTLIKGFAEDSETEVAAAVNKGALLDKIRSLNVKMYELPDKSAASAPLFYLGFLNMVRDFKPDIIHAHNRYVTVLAHILPFRKYNLVQTIRSDNFTGRWTRFFGDSTVAVSRGCKEHFVKYFNVREDSVEVIYNGVVFPDNSIPEPVFERRDGEIIASVIGEFRPWKGHEVLVRAIAELPDYVRDRFKVLFVGDGEKRGELERLTKELAVQKNVVFLGYQNDVRPYIAASDFTILPSLQETFGRVVIESYLFKKPVIGTNIGGTPEVITDNETGLLVPPGDHGALARAILRFVENPELVLRYGDAGRLAIEKFTVKKMISDYKAFYKKVLRNNNAA